MSNFSEEMKNTFKIEVFPAYPNTGNPNKDAQEFASQLKQFTLLRSDPVYYTSYAVGTTQPSFFKQNKNI